LSSRTLVGEISGTKVGEEEGEEAEGGAAAPAPDKEGFVRAISSFKHLLFGRFSFSYEEDSKEGVLRESLSEALSHRLHEEVFRFFGEGWPSAKTDGREGFGS
jgi:hypothetical protein